MEQVKVTVALIIAVLLQWTLEMSRALCLYRPALIIVVYAAPAKRDPRNSFPDIAGLAVDPCGGFWAASQKR